MNYYEWSIVDGKWNSSFSLRPSLTTRYHRRRVMTCQPTFLQRAFPQAVFLFTILSVCVAQSLAQGGGGSNNPTSPSRGAGVSHTIRGKIFMPSGNLPDQRLRVVLELNTGGIVNEVFSDSVGNFEFRSLS